MDRGSAKAIGHYTVVHSLEPSGGMGRHAHLALRAEPPGSSQLFVLKELDAHAVPPREAERHLDAAGMLKHRAQLGVVERFEHGGKLVIVFEHHDGLRLDQIQDHLERERERLADAAIAHIGYELAGALAEAHEARTHTGRLMRMLHGHLAPDMVYLCWSGEIRVLGTGLTPLFADAERNEAARQYESPEMKSGSRPSALSDVHAVAAIVWCLFTGRRPPPEGRGFTKLGYLRKDVPAALADALEHALNFNPASRTISCRDLEGVIAGAYPSVHDRAELRWNLELFRALSMLSWSLPPAAPPTQTRVEVGRLPRPISLVPPPPSSLEPVTQPNPTQPTPTQPRPTARDVELEPPTQKDGSRAVLDSTLAAEGASDPLNDSLGSTQVYDALASEDDEAIEQGEASTRISRREASPAPPQPAHPEPRQPEPEPLPMRTVMLDEGMAPPPLPPAPAQHAAPPPMPSPQPSASPPPLPVSTPSAQRLDAPTAGSAWQRPVTAVPVEAKPAQRMNRGVLVAAGLVTIAGVAAVIVLATRGDPSPAPASAPRSTSTSVALADGSGGQPGEQPGEQPSAETAQEQRPTASATASAATSGEPDGALPAYSDDGRDGAKLLSYLGFLVVRSTADADVYVQGVRLGTTNQKLEARCWTRNVRLREKNDGAWLTPGAPVTITCMDTTTVRMDP